MTEPLSVDAAVLLREAANFERVADGLRDQLIRVESIAANLATQWKGNAADAAHDAIRWFHEASAAQVKTLNGISNNLQTAGARYSTTDDQQSQRLASQMGMGGVVDERNAKLPRNGTVKLAGNDKPLTPGGAAGPDAPKPPPPHLPPPLKPDPTDEKWEHGGDRRWTSAASAPVKKELVRASELEMERNDQSTAKSMLDHYLDNTGTPKTLPPEQVDSWLSNTATDYPRTASAADAVNYNISALQQRAVAAARESGEPVTLVGNTPWTTVAGNDGDYVRTLGHHSLSTAYEVTANPDGTYAMTYRNDIYDWYNFDTYPYGSGLTQQVSSMAHDLQSAGVAQEFLITGSGTVHTAEGQIP